MGTHITNSNPTTVAQLAVSYPNALAVFSQYNIDYCCGGHTSLEDACERMGLHAKKIMAEIMQTGGKGVSQMLRPENWTSAFLADYIIQNHHSYVKQSIPEVQALLDKVCETHGSHVTELLQIRIDFRMLAVELIDHMAKEELILFPEIKRTASHSNHEHPILALMQAPLNVMEHEHIIAGDIIKQIRSLSNNYTPPDFACPTFSLTYKKLQEFDQDLMQHIHLENNILFERFKEKNPIGNTFA